jgi:hypothetical protein
MSFHVHLTLLCRIELHASLAPFSPITPSVFPSRLVGESLLLWRSLLGLLLQVLWGIVLLWIQVLMLVFVALFPMDLTVRPFPWGVHVLTICHIYILLLSLGGNFNRSLAIFMGGLSFTVTLLPAEVCLLWDLLLTTGVHTTSQVVLYPFGNSFFHAQPQSESSMPTSWGVSSCVGI